MKSFHEIQILTQIRTTPTGYGKHLALRQLQRLGFVGQTYWHYKMRKGNWMFQSNNGNVIVLIVGILLVVGMDIDLIETNIQGGVGTA